MRKIALLLCASALVFTSCDDASSKIKNGNEAAKTAVTPTTTTPAATNNAAPTTSTPTSVIDAEGAPAFSFNKEKHDFGDIQEGEKPATVFTFTNTGDAPLIISNAKGSCGCTVPTWPKEPIAPGATGEIPVEFDSKGKAGAQSKTVTITANTVPNTKVLTITGTVIKAAE